MQNSIKEETNFIQEWQEIVAFACKMSFELNYEGVVSFIAKTQLIAHYKETLGAKVFGGNRMFIDTNEAFILAKKYFQKLLMMINFKKMDDKDFVFINKSLSTQEEKEFSDFLKSRRKKARQIRARKKIKTVVSKTVKR